MLVRQEGIAGIVVTDAEYPQRVAFSFINKMTDDFLSKYPEKKDWSGLSAQNSATQFPELKGLITKYQEPNSADPMMRVQKELDDTKVILVRIIRFFVTTFLILSRSTRRWNHCYREERSSMIW